MDGGVWSAVCHGLGTLSPATSFSSLAKGAGIAAIPERHCDERTQGKCLAPGEHSRVLAVIVAVLSSTGL